jgi:hypothetical protein
MNTARITDKKHYEMTARRLTDHYRKNMTRPEGFANPHLDHIVSIDFGFEHNIPVEVVCLPENLTWSEEQDNLKKGSSLTKEGIELLKKWYDDKVIDTPIGSLKEKVNAEYSFDKVYEKIKSSPYKMAVVEEMPADVALNFQPVWCQRREDLRWQKTKRAMGHVPLITHRMMMCVVYPDGSIERVDGNTRSYIFKNNLQFSDYLAPESWHVTFFGVADKEEAEKLYHSIDSSDTAETFSEKLSGYLRHKGYHVNLPAKMQKGEQVYDIAVVALDNYVPDNETEAVTLSYEKEYSVRANQTAEKLDYFIDELVTIGKMIDQDNTPQMLTAPLLGMLIRYLMVDKSDRAYTGIDYIVQTFKEKKYYFPFNRPKKFSDPADRNLLIMMDELQTRESIGDAINNNVPKLEVSSRRILPDQATSTTKNMSDRKLYCGWIAYCFDKYLRGEVMNEDIIFDVTGKKILPSTPYREVREITAMAHSKIMQEYDNFWKKH